MTNLIKRTIENDCTVTIESKNFKISIASICKALDSDNSISDVELINLLTKEELSLQYDRAEEKLIYKTADILHFFQVENLNNLVKSSECFINSRMFECSIEAVQVIAEITYSVVSDSDCNNS